MRTVYNEFMSLLGFLFIFQSTFASELAGSKAAQVAKPVRPISYAQVELNNCQPQEEAASKKTEEDFAKTAAQNNDLPKEEILARLIFSETLSTGFFKNHCQAPSAEAIMESIGWGVMKRVAAKKKTVLDPYTAVVFAKMQFRTSFSGKKKNDFAEAFLCPLRSANYLKEATTPVDAAALYKKAQETAQKVIGQYEEKGLSLKYKKITNFFYPRSEFFGEMRPSWAKDKDLKKNKGYVNILEVFENPCVEFYEL